MQILSQGSKTAPPAGTILAGSERVDGRKLFGWYISAEEGNTFTLTYETESDTITEAIVLNAGGVAAILSDTVPLTDELAGAISLKNDDAGASEMRYLAKLFIDDKPIQEKATQTQVQAQICQ
jgi:hypothetical protein